MEDRVFTLVEMIRDPRMLVCETSELTPEGHYYLYRYHGSEGSFYRATVPSGAADKHFYALEAADKIPLGGWQVVETSIFSKRQLHLVKKKKRRSVGSLTGDPEDTSS
jgi:hypothetical protein